jgi:hypothetical protein
VGLPQTRRAHHVAEKKGHRPRRNAHSHPDMVSHNAPPCSESAVPSPAAVGQRAQLMLLGWR